MLQEAFNRERAAFEKLVGGDLKKFESEWMKSGKPKVSILAKPDFIQSEND